MTVTGSILIDLSDDDSATFSDKARKRVYIGAVDAPEGAPVVLLVGQRGAPTRGFDGYTTTSWWSELVASHPVQVQGPGCVVAAWVAFLRAHERAA